MKTFERHALRRQMQGHGREKRKKAGFGLWFVCLLLHLSDLETIVGAGHFQSAHDEGDDEREITAGSEEKKGGERVGRGTRCLDAKRAEETRLTHFGSCQRRRFLTKKETSYCFKNLKSTAAIHRHYI